MTIHFATMTNIPPALKVVAFRTERGFANSAFKIATEGLFLQDLFEGEARAEKYSYDDWNGSSPASDNGQFDYNDWGSL